LSAGPVGSVLDPTLHATHAFDQIVVGKRVGEAQIAGSAERLARDSGDMAFVKQRGGQFGRVGERGLVGRENPLLFRLGGFAVCFLRGFA